MKHPSYPRAYKNNLNCLWTVRAPINHILEIDFKYFNIDISGNCAEDYVDIFDGSNNQARFLEKLCGKIAGRKIRSTGNAISVLMITNDKRTSQGFVARWTRIEKVGPTPDVFETTPTTQKVHVSSPKPTVARKGNAIP